MSTDADPLGQLDPDDPRPGSQQIASLLRAAILTKRFAPGDRLPSQPALAGHYNVARETVKNALDILRRDRLIVTRRGSGSFVRAQTERPVGLRPHIEAAFAVSHVTIDFAGFSGETLQGALQEALDKIRAGRLTPETIAIRILLPDLSVPTVVPSRADGGVDDPAVRERAGGIIRRHMEAIVESVRELSELGLVREAKAEVRTYVTTPQFKLYILNQEEAFFGFYPIVQHEVPIKGEPLAINDVMGKDATLFPFTAEEDDGSTAAEYVAQARLWFDSVWKTLGRDHEA
jgi:DNA-binding transcriptional regulator YhcF (GntR family)